MEISNKKILIYGLGISGNAVYNFLKEKGLSPYVYDDNENALKSYYVVHGCEVFTKNTPIDLVIISPTVRRDREDIQEFVNAGAEIITEPEFASLFCRGKIIGVTGTNGKTTVVTLTDHMLNKCGYVAHPCGNIGIPFISIAEKIKEDEFAVLELSSYQLLGAESLKLDYALLINVHGDHLDFHKDLDEYIDSKLKILSFGIKTVVNDSDDYISNNNIDGSYSISTTCEVERGVYVENNLVYFKQSENDKVALFELDDLSKMQGIYLENCLLAVCVTKIIGGQNIKILEAVESYPFEPYRLAKSGVVKGVTFYNDSKATNIHSTLGALKTIKGNCALILGGRDKGVSYDELLYKIGDNVKYILIVGENEKLIKEACLNASFYNYYRFDTLEEVVEYAISLGGIKNVLFSPSASSFDKYNGYDQRGAHYDEIIQQLLEI